MGFKAEEFEELARATPGVREVRNEIRAFQPRPATTASGRGRAARLPARRLHEVRDPARPPIHVVVEAAA